MGKQSLKDFNPPRVASLDTQMWKAYYRHDFFTLLNLLIALFKEQFGVSQFSAWRLGYFTMQAARHFRKTGDMKTTEEYLQKYYRLLNSRMIENFDPALAAKTELEWWTIHRYPSQGSLNDALAKNMAALYSLPVSRFKTYATERAQAMELRDTATHKLRREPDWNAVQQHLERSYNALLKEVCS